MSRNHTRMNTRRWQATRRAAFRRDGYRCRKCGRRGRLEAHHEPPLTAGADPYDLDGILTYCRLCHIERHRPDQMTQGRAEWRRFVLELMRPEAV